MMFVGEAIIAEVDKPENRDLVEEAAIEFLGWKWMTMLGMPMNNHPLYRDEHTRKVGIPVRTFMSPKMLADKRWKEYLAENQAREATPEDPLAYCYCSSGGHAWPGWSPQSDVVADVEKELKNRNLFDAYILELAAIEVIDGETRHRPSMRQCLLASLNVADKERSKS